MFLEALDLMEKIRSGIDVNCEVTIKNGSVDDVPLINIEIISTVKGVRFILEREYTKLFIENINFSDDVFIKEIIKLFNDGYNEAIKA